MGNVFELTDGRQAASSERQTSNERSGDVMGDVIQLHRRPTRPPRLRRLLNATRGFKTLRSSREWLAEEIDVDVETVKQWERGRDRIPANVARP